MQRQRFRKEKNPGNVIIIHKREGIFMKNFSLKNFIPLLVLLAFLLIKGGYFDRLTEELDSGVKKIYI